MSSNLSIFKTEALPTAVYIFHKSDQVRQNQTFFGFVRKIPQGGRQLLHPGGNIGAAGTDIKYHGKWTSIGGGAKGNKTNIQRAIDELNDETGVFERKIRQKFIPRDVDFSPLGIPNPNPNPAIICHLAQNLNGVAVFLFEIRDSVLFFNIFPEQGYTNQVLATSSLREIDAIQSYTMTQIVTLQNNEVQTISQNYFINYSINTFNRLILPKMYLLNAAFATKWSGKVQINVMADTLPRSIQELHHNPYHKKYLKYKTKYLELKTKYL